MGSARHKPEFPPLLQPGLHEMSVDDLKAVVVDGFPLSTGRETLWTNFLGIVHQLKTVGISCKIWIDGSFLTKKIEPDDVDFVVDVPAHVADNPTPAQKALLNELGNLAFCKTGKLHSFLMLNAPLVHKYYALSQRLHEQWKRDFGFAYVSREPKGIAVVTVKP
jgi:hypothetical protein